MIINHENEGHSYEVANFENPEVTQKILFIQKRPAVEGKDYKVGDPGPSMVVVQDGTTNEELLKVLFHRTTFLNQFFPCKENEIALDHIKQALHWLETRTMNRVERGVEGTHQV